MPRPETELAVATALDLVLSRDSRVLDVGTGSGCIAITLAAERPRWRVSGLDRSLAALIVARRNRAHHRVDVSFFQGNLVAAVGPPWDLIVANLPYVPTPDLERLSMEVGRDPEVALDGGADGLDLVRRLLSELPRILRSCGGAVLEIGDGQADAVSKLAYGVGLAVARKIRDMSGTERVVVLQPR